MAKALGWLGPVDTYFEPEREDDDFAWVVWVAECGAGPDAETLLPLAQTLVVLICNWIVSKCKD